MKYNKLITKIVDIDLCYHYLGYRYGGYKNNLYEDFIVGLYQGKDIAQVKLQFMNRIFGTRTFEFGEALKVNLRQKYPKWSFPWSPTNHASNSAHSNPDIICHTSKAGILASHINREFEWLIAALENMKNSYQPEKYGYITLLELYNGALSHYIVLDGNHRISALHALGHKKIEVKVLPKKINYRYRYFWKGILSRKFNIHDAEIIFNRYFYENNLEINEVNNCGQIIYDEPIKW